MNKRNSELENLVPQQCTGYFNLVRYHYNGSNVTRQKKKFLLHLFVFLWYCQQLKIDFIAPHSMCLPYLVHKLERVIILNMQLTK